ncbi:SPOR domain-containing protein [Asticcacaulis machinosus]|uniref:SPOR domain-containing protein n=1 Tax=Asticcacaulis machinosus TaxID=2984211 RepID=A0ABT5HFJ5_9CAUL|nr:SPOR domain-containing protein [Asticcacaulis machinosus]MDC7675029.1 SPOR domain-containing protein [Asticcacaulis machinosus]
MVDKDRGTYTPPTEDNLSYEARQGGNGGRPQTPITLIASGIVLVVLLLAVVMFYNSGLNSRKDMAEIGESLSNYKDNRIEDARPLTDEDLLDPVAPDAEPKFAPGTEDPIARADASATVSEAPPPAEAKIGAIPGNAVEAPASAPAVPAEVPAPIAKVETPKPVTAGAGAAVQIGAFASREIADQQYAALASSYGLFVSGTKKSVETVDRDGTTLYRTSFSGFASKDKAKAFCDALKSAGKSCFVR